MQTVLQSIYHRLINELDISTFRYLYQSFNINQRLTGLIGPRGVGKTTLMLQYIKYKIPNIQDAFYFSADHIFFNRTTLFDFVQELYETEDIKVFFIDEVHKYLNWSQELKNIYDSFPRIKVVFSGSSSLDLVEGSHDLSRRGTIYNLKGLSFREYINFATDSDYSAFDFNTLISRSTDISLKLSRIPKLKGLWHRYLEQGYYPFIFEGGTFYEKLSRVIDKTIYEDIAQYYNLKTVNLHLFKKLLIFLATIPPGEIKIHNLAQNLMVDDKTVLNYMRILSETGLIRFVFSANRGNRLLRKPEKAFLDNTALLHAICHNLGQEVNIGTRRELFFISSLENAGLKIHYSKKGGDYIAGDIVFEIRGRNKTGRQLKKVRQKSILAKDDILTGSKNTIPLYLFGFLY